MKSLKFWVESLPLAQHVAIHAPDKPRALMNFGVLLASRGQLRGGRALLERAAWATQLPHIRPWDRFLMQRDLAQNWAALKNLEAQLRQP